MKIRVRFFCDDNHHSFEYQVNSPDPSDSLNSVSAQLGDYCNSHDLQMTDIVGISTYLA